MSSPYPGFGSLPKSPPIQPEMDWINGNHRRSFLPTAPAQRPPTPWDGISQTMDVDTSWEVEPWTPKFDLKVPSLTLHIPTTTTTTAAAYGKTRTGGDDDVAHPSARSLWPQKGEKGESSKSKSSTKMAVDVGNDGSPAAMAVDSSNDNNSPTAMALDGSFCTMKSGLRESRSTAASVPCGGGERKRKNSRLTKDLKPRDSVTGGSPMSSGSFLGRLRSRSGRSSPRGGGPRSGEEPPMWYFLNWSGPRSRGGIDVPLSPKSQPPPLAAAVAAIVSQAEAGGPAAGSRSRRAAALAKARTVRDATSARWRKLKRMGMGKEDKGKGKGREVPDGPALLR